MKKLITVSFLLLMLFISGFVNAVEVEVSSFVNSYSVVKGKEILLNIDIAWIGNPDDLQLSPLKKPDCFMLEVVGAKQNNLFKMYPEKNLNKISIQYTLKATEAGAGRISYVPVEYTLKSTGVKKVDKTTPYDIKVLSKKQYFIKNAVWCMIWFLVAIIIAGTTILIKHFYKLKKRKDKLTNFDDVSAKTGLETSIIAELKAVRKYKLSGETDKFFDSITSILNKYFEQRYGVSASKIGSVSDNNQAGIPQKILLDFKDISAVTNKIKFSGEKLTPEEMDRWYKQAEKIVMFFIDKSRKDEIEKINFLDKEKN